MRVVPFAVCLLPAAILAAIGFLIKYKKAYWLIAGYNTMPAAKKKNVDIEELAKFVSAICFLIAAIDLAAAVFMAAGKIALAVAAFALLFPVIIYTLVKAQKYDRNNYNPDGKMKTGAKAIIGSIIALFVLIAAGAGTLLHFGAKSAEYTVEDGILSISGMYGREIAIAEIESLELRDSMPGILLRTNGSALGTMLKGHFRLKDMGEALLFVDKSTPPFIFIKTGTATVILNCEESEKTKALFERLETKLDIKE